MGYSNIKGAEWAKWDLHVHTPESLVHHFKNKTVGSDIWEEYIKDLENLPSEFKVIGINDYLFLDGYRKVLEYKKQGRLQNIDLILPVIEFRLKKFAGHKQFKRINFHVIFSDELGPELIQNQFLNTLTGSYTLTPGIDRSMWSGAITIESLQDLGKKIKESVPENQQENYGSDLEEGFNNLNLDEKQIIEKLEKSTYFTGKFLFAIGKTEWDSLPWSDGSIAEKKDVINHAHIVFTASESVELFYNAKNKLSEQKVNDLLLDCSDAHHNSNSVDKDRIGNCFTWIKADRTFNGLRQIVNESDRVFVGDIPNVISRVENNKTKYIKSLNINRISNYNLGEKWFDNTTVEFNNELVAIIGNKGNGKSALADIIGLAGNTKNGDNFSFLKNEKFRKPNPNRASYFTATLNWESDTSNTINLNDKIPSTSLEKVKYIPQNFLEKLCNENVNDLEEELRNVIFSHVTESDKLKQISLDTLIKFKSEVIIDKIDKIKIEITEINKRIIELEKINSNDYRISVQEKLNAKKAELESHNLGKPIEVIEPNQDEELQKEQIQITASIQELRNILEEKNNEIKTKKQERVDLNFELSELNKFIQSLDVLFESYEKIKNDYRDSISKYGFDIDNILKIQIDKSLVENRIRVIDNEVKRINKLLDVNESSSLEAIKKQTTNKIKQLTLKLTEPGKLYQTYIENLKAWQITSSKILGEKNTEGGILYYENLLKYIDENLNNDINVTKLQRIELCKSLLDQKQKIISIYKELYQPVSEFINLDTSLTLSYPISLDASLKITSFDETFFSYISNGAKGSFYGKDEGVLRLKSILENIDFNKKDDVIEFINIIINYLEYDQRENSKNEKREIQNQIKKDGYLNFYDFLFGFDYLVPYYELKLDNKSIKELSPGEKGALLLIFYLILDQDDIPLIIDQPEENLDNQSVYDILVPYIKEAKKRRQIIIVTHNPNLAVVCDAEQIIHVKIDKADKNNVSITSGAIENPAINKKLVEILEGTLPAFNNRDLKYAITKQV